MNRARVVLRVLMFMLCGAVILAAAAPLARTLTGKWPELVIGTVASIATFVLTMLFVRWDGLRLGDVGAALKLRSTARFAVGFLAGLLLVALWAFISNAVGYERWVRAPRVDFSGTMVAILAYAALACREELAFRGYPLRRLHQLFPMWTAQFIVALVFAAEHRLGGSPWMESLLGPGVGSLLFGMASIATRGLAVPIGLHAAWNFGQWTLGLKGAPGFWRPLVEESQQGRAHGTGTIAYVAVITSATFVFWLWSRHAASHTAPV